MNRKYLFLIAGILFLIGVGLAGLEHEATVVCRVNESGASVLRFGEPSEIVIFVGNEKLLNYLLGGDVKFWEPIYRTLPGQSQVFYKESYTWIEFSGWCSESSWFYGNVSPLINNGWHWHWRW